MDVFLKLKNTDKVEQLGERSASQAHANIIFGYNLWQGALEKQLHPGR